MRHGAESPRHHGPRAIWTREVVRLLIVGSNPTLTSRFGSSPNSMSNTMRNGVIPHMELLIDKRSIRFD